MVIHLKKSLLVVMAISLSFLSSGIPTVVAYAATPENKQVELNKESVSDETVSGPEKTKKTELVTETLPTINSFSDESMQFSHPKKVFVCKYVGTPGDNERLQTGQNPISVSVNSIKNYHGVGSYFNDSQGRSYVLAENNRQPKPDVSACPAPDVPVTKYMTVVWKVVDTNNNGDDWEQTMVGHVVTSMPNLSELDYLLVNTSCNRYQVDVYNYTSANDKAKVDTLITGGVLYSPNNPPEPLIPGGSGVAYKLVGHKGVCPITVTPCSELSSSAVLAKEDFIGTLSDTRATGHYLFTQQGLHIWTEGNTPTDKVAEYWSINKSLQQIGNPSTDYTNNGGGTPGLQLVVDFNNDGTPDGILVGESVYGNDWWLSNGSSQLVKDNAPSHTGGSGSANHGTLNQWLTNFPNAKVLAGGFSLGSGVKGDGVIKSVTIGCVTYTFKYVAPPQPTVCTTWSTIHSTNLNKNGWTVPSDATYVENGIKLTVSGNWNETYIERSFVGSLANIGMGVDLTASPIQYAGIHIVTSKGILVYEKESTYNGKWWSTSDFGVSAGMGYATFDTVENIVAANPDVTTSLIRVLYTNPEANSSVVSGVKIGCVEYTFDSELTPTTPGQILGDNAVSTPKILAASTTLPSSLPATGTTSSTTLFVTIFAGLLTYGAVYFLQGKRDLVK